ncbi:signal peptidase I [Bacillus sp. FJAT-52991]|uniref:Signal peptidase I n=1 Tax=Bacillus kandeliae TaxID=3129297 RepID=A0ABZ2N7S8_9BACI
MSNSHAKEEWKSWIKALLIAVGLGMVIKTFMFAPYLVKGASMEPTLHNSEKVFVNKLKSADDLKRGDIIIAEGEDKENHYVKRIIGLPGDQVEMVDDQLFINGKLQEEPYLAENRQIAKQGGMLRLTGDFGPVAVPENEYFVMGDNRLYSMDSRNGLGLIQEENIVGKGEFVFYPVSHFRDVK